ncbi:MAG TPA: SGNH/GDSL hydrolase family protein, partial [Thermoanaerobaculia bacterium]|nr:SGNH/GDSL hydrolase family protein [Thermoanaerobaculia bacterium]
PRILEGLRQARGGRAVLARTQVNRALSWSALYRLVRYGQAEEEAEEATAGAASSGASGDTVEPALRELAGLARRHRFEVLLAVFPYLPKPYEKEHADRHAWLAERAREHGFHHLDLRPAFRACRQETTEKLGFDRYHPTPAGHRCAARALTAAVRTILR